jgi:hypothetical protein
MMIPLQFVQNCMQRCLALSMLRLTFKRHHHKQQHMYQLQNKLFSVGCLPECILCNFMQKRYSNYYKNYWNGFFSQVEIREMKRTKLSMIRTTLAPRTNTMNTAMTMMSQNPTIAQLVMLGSC